MKLTLNLASIGQLCNFSDYLDSLKWRI
jgi:hypothetical protein